MIPVIVIKKQSNAVGRGAVETIANYAALGLHLPYAHVPYMYLVADEPDEPLIWSPVGPTTLRPMPGGNQGICGIELTLGRRLHEAGFTHGIAKCAIGSTRLSHWASDTIPQYPNAPADRLFDQDVAFFQSALTAMDGYVAAAISVHGESDAGAASAFTYATKFGELWSDWRDVFGPCPIFLNRLHSQAGGSFNAEVRAQMDTITETVPDTHIIDCDDLGLIGAHFTGDGYATLGDRFAARILGRLGVTTRAVSIAVGISL